MLILILILLLLLLLLHLLLLCHLLHCHLLHWLHWLHGHLHHIVDVWVSKVHWWWAILHLREHLRIHLRLHLHHGRMNLLHLLHWWHHRRGLLNKLLLRNLFWLLFIQSLWGLYSGCGDWRCYDFFFRLFFNLLHLFFLNFDSVSLFLLLVLLNLQHRKSLRVLSLSQYVSILVNSLDCWNNRWRLLHQIVLTYQILQLFVISLKQIIFSFFNFLRRLDLL